MKENIIFPKIEIKQLKQYLHEMDHHKDAIDDLIQSSFILLERIIERKNS